MQTDTSQADAGGEGSDDDYEKVRLGGGAHISATEGAVEGGGRLSESWGPWGWRVEPGTEAWLPAQAGSQRGGGTPPRSRATTLTLTLDPDHSGATAQLSLHQHHRVLRGGKVGAPSAFLHGLVWADLRFSAPPPPQVSLPFWPPPARALCACPCGPRCSRSGGGGWGWRVPESCPRPAPLHAAVLL